MNVRKVSLSLMAYVAGSTVLLSASAAGAAVHHHGGGHGTKSAAVASAAPHLPANLPAGYSVVTSTFPAAAGVQSGGYVKCPGTKQPTGGGAFVDTANVVVNINSSKPDGQYWEVDVNNASASDTSFTVYAVCMAHSAKYQVVASGPWTAYSNWVSSEAATCPKGTAVTGGGAASDTLATDVNMNSSVPNLLTGGRTAWRVAMGSYDPSDSTFFVYAVCRPKPIGYSIQMGQPGSMGAYNEVQAVVTCPGASVPIGGGGFTNFLTNDVGLAMNSSYPWTNEWVLDENNDEDLVKSFQASAVCAGS